MIASSRGKQRGLLRGLLERPDDHAWRDRFRQDLGRFGGVFGIDQHQRDTGAIVPSQFVGDFGREAGVITDQGNCVGLFEFF